MLYYEQKSTRMLTPKAVLRVAELLETPEIAALNRKAGFADPASKKPPLGRWKRAAAKWLAAAREEPAHAPGPGEGGLQGDAQEARPQGRLQARDRRRSSRCSAGSRSRRRRATAPWASTASSCAKRERFDGLSEAEICEAIETQKLSLQGSRGPAAEGRGAHAGHHGGAAAVAVGPRPAHADADAGGAGPDGRAGHPHALGEGGGDGDRPARAEHRQERPEQGAAREARGGERQRRAKRRWPRPPRRRTCG